MPMFPTDTIEQDNEESIEETGYKEIYTIDEAIDFKLREKTVIAMENGSIFEGEIVGTFERFGIEYQIVNTKYFTHSVLNGVSQEATTFRYSRFDELIEDTPEETITVDFKVPKSSKMDVLMLKDNEVIKQRMTIESIDVVRGVEIVTVSAKPFNLRVYNGYVIASVTSPIDSMNKYENLKEFLDQWIEDNFK